MPQERLPSKLYDKMNEKEPVERPRVVNGPIRSGPNPAQTQKCKPETENNLKVVNGPQKTGNLFSKNAKFR